LQIERIIFACCNALLLTTDKYLLICQHCPHKKLFYWCSDDPPQLKSEYQTSVVAEVGSTARIVCPVYGPEDRKPLVTWSKDGSLVHIGWDRYRTSRAGLTLLIDNAQEYDNAMYTCSASNGFGTVDVSIRLTVVRE
jgi:hypothetical protein